MHAHRSCRRRGSSSSTSTTPSATTRAPAPSACGIAFAAALGERAGDGRVDLDAVIAESIAIHPHGTDHFGDLLTRHGAERADAVEEARRWYQHNRFLGLALFPDAVETLTRVRRALPGRRVGVITNGPADVQRAKVELLALEPYVDFALISGEFGAAKPEPAIFREALRLGEATAAEAIFVGDSPEFDIAGARAAAIRSIWMNRTGRPWPAPDPPPDHEVTSLDELHPLLGAA